MHIRPIRRVKKGACSACHLISERWICCLYKTISDPGTSRQQRKSSGRSRGWTPLTFSIKLQAPVVPLSPFYIKGCVIKVREIEPGTALLLNQKAMLQQTAQCRTCCILKSGRSVLKSGNTSMCAHFWNVGEINLLTKIFSATHQKKKKNRNYAGTNGYLFRTLNKEQEDSWGCFPGSPKWL